MEVITGEVYGKGATLESVNQHALERLDELIQEASPEELPGLIESLAKYNSSIRNNEIFTPEETAEERHSRERSAAMASVLGGE